MNASDYAALDESLESMTAAGPDLLNSLSNHAPMAIEAMCAMHRSDAVERWFDKYRRLLAPRGPRVGRLTNENWREALGDLRRTEDWFEFFMNEFEERPWQTVLAVWAARLAPGLMAAATHGVIRTGHAVRALALKDTPIRRRELADGLGYWAADYMTLPAQRHAPVRAMPSEAIAREQMIPPEMRTKELGAFTDALKQLDSFEPFKNTLDAVDTSVDANAFLSDLTQTFAKVFIPNARNIYTTIAFVHAVTGPSALRPLLPYLDKATTRDALAYAWQASAAMYATFGTSADLSSHFSNGKAWDKDELIERAIANGDEHAIKFTEVCLRENSVSPNPIFFAAANHALNMLSGSEG